MLVVAFTYIIYILLRRKEDFKEINQSFYEEIIANKNLSKNVILEHFQEVEKETDRILKQFNFEAEKNFTIQIEKMKEIEKKLEYFSEMQKVDIEEMMQEVKKKDAIINRKNRQIERLKEEKDKF
jgi:hypothetical protein